MHRSALAAALALATLGSAAFAQQAQQTAPDQQHDSTYRHRHHSHDPHKVAARMSQRLNLSADQTARLEPILAARQQKMDALRADQSLTPDARREQFRAIHADTKQQLAGVLTPDQLAQMKAMHRGRGHRHSEPIQPSSAPTA